LRPVPATIRAGTKEMQDLLFLAITGAVFAGLFGLVKGVDRLRQGAGDE